MSWANSLIRLSTYEVEVLQKRLAEITERRAHAEMRLAVLFAEGEAETARAREDAQAGWYLVGFKQGLALRMAVIESEIQGINLEEAGAREALGLAFEDQKKYEQVAEGIRLVRNKEEARRETAAMDELGLRRASATGR